MTTCVREARGPDFKATRRSPSAVFTEGLMLIAAEVGSIVGDNREDTDTDIWFEPLDDALLEAADSVWASVPVP